MGNSTRNSVSTLSLLAFLGLALLVVFAPTDAIAQSDGDGDGVEDAVDLCPAEDSSLFDGDGDGCIDPTANARHIEYWAVSDLPLNYVIHQDGAPTIDDGSDFVAIQDGFATWTTVPGAAITVQYDGTTPQFDADGMDGINLVTFEDQEFLAIYGTTVLAVGVTTSFTEPTMFGGDLVRPGQIVDADMIFNPARIFSTPTAGSNVDLQSVVTHEAGHLLGINHSVIFETTMFPAIASGTQAQTLELDDEVVAFMAYPDPAGLPGATTLGGTVVDGATLDPVPGAAILVIDAGTDTEVASQFTLPDGSWQVAGLPPGPYFVYVHPLDGGEGVNGVIPGLINELIAATAQTLFVAEYYDAAESDTDDSEDRTAVDLVAGDVTTVDIITNVDATAPSVTEFAPVDGDEDVRADAVLLVQLDEPVDFDSALASIKVERVESGGDVGVGGTLAALSGDDVLVFTPSGLLDYDSTFRITMRAGLEDVYGNATPADISATFETEPPPPLRLNSVSPTQVVPGSVVVINGEGFLSGDPAAHLVDFGGLVVTALTATATNLIATVPAALDVGGFALSVSLVSGESSLNTLSMERIVPAATPLGSPAVTSPLPGSPKALAVLPDGNFAYVATSVGVTSVLTEPNSFDVGSLDPTDVTVGADDVVVTPDGTRAYAISSDAQLLHVINSAYGLDPDSPAPDFNTVLASLEVGATPRGVAVAPTGQRTYVSTDDGVIQVWDTQLGSSTYNRRIAEIARPQPDLLGPLALDPTGDRLFALSTGDGLVAYSTADNSLLGAVSVGVDPRDVAVAPQGDLAYVSDGSGQLAVVLLSSLSTTQTIHSGGSGRGVSIGPDGLMGFVANRYSDELDILDLNPGSGAFRTAAGRVDVGGDPTDVAVTPDGLRVISLQEADATLTISAIGSGPTIDSYHPRGVRPGQILALGGSGYAVQDTTFPVVPELSQVLFDDELVTPLMSDADLLWVRIPDDFDGGPVRVRTTSDAVVPGNPLYLESNPIFLDLIDPAPESDLDVGVFVGDFTTYDWSQVGVGSSLAVSPDGKYLLAEELSGKLIAIGADVNSPNYLQKLGEMVAGGDPTFAPDGKLLYQIYNGNISYFDADILSPSFGMELGQVDFAEYSGPPGMSGLTMVPNGEFLLVEDTEGRVFFVDARESSIYRHEAESATPFTDPPSDLEVHPSGLWAYYYDFDGIYYIIGLDPFQPSYQTIDSTFSTEQGFPQDMAITPDGNFMLILTRVGGLGGDHELEVWDVSRPNSPTNIGLVTVESASSPDEGRLVISPDGNRAFIDIPNRRALEMNLEALYTGGLPQGHSTINQGGNLQLVNAVYSVDATRLFLLDPGDTGMNVFDYTDPVYIVTQSGDAQIGTIGETLPAPVRVQILDYDFYPSPGAPIEVEVEPENGSLPGGDVVQILVSDFEGFIEIDWTLGETPGLNELNLYSYHDISSSSVLATGVTDPGTLPMELAQVLPLTGTADLAITTTLQATFSRPVKVDSIDETSLFVHVQGDPTPVLVAYGFSDENRSVSLIPIEPLDFSTVYEIEITANILDAADGALANPTTTSFTTQAPPPLVLTSVSPPSGVIGTEVVLGGQGFAADLGDNTIFLGGVEIAPLDGGADFLRFVVPVDGITGGLTVESGPQVSNALSFAVLEPTNAPVDEIVATVDLGVTTQGIAITPDGSRAYSVSTETDQVLPLDLVTLGNLGAVGVGDSPVAIVIHPAGTLAYVANFVSNDVSVIELSTDTVIETVPVGNNPQELVMDPLGGAVYVISSVDQEVQVIDADPVSATFNTVTSSLQVGATTRGSAVSPDGSELYLGTNDGFLIVELDPLFFGVVMTVRTGSTTRSAAVSPDGGLLILTTDDGDILVVDVSVGGENAVVATVKTGSTSRAAAVSPDGSLLYVLFEDSDEIEVYDIEVGGSVSVVEADAQFFLVTLTLIDTFVAGDDPFVIAFDPSGSGLGLVANNGDGSISLLNASSTPIGGPAAAVITIEPDPVTIQAPNKEVEICITLPAGSDPSEIRLDSIRLMGDCPVAPTKSEIGDRNGDGVDELCVTVDVFQFFKCLPPGDQVEVVVSGELDPGGLPFSGTATIRTLRATVLYPCEGDEFFATDTITAIWDNPDDMVIGRIALKWSPDGGLTWSLVENDAGVVESYPWEVPMRPTHEGMFCVTLYDDKNLRISEGVCGPFRVVDPSVPVAMQDVRIDVDGGDGALHWKTSGYGVDGFHVLRGESESGGFERVSAEPVRPVEDGGSLRFEFVDEEIRPNRNYYYLLEEVRQSGAGFQHGPFKLSYIVGNALEQNYPNPYNPVTTIRFSLSDRARTRLSVYNLAGRKVKTLIDDVLPADNYAVQWFGRDDNGASVASGVYLYALETDKGYRKTMKMVLVR